MAIFGPILTKNSFRLEISELFSSRAKLFELFPNFLFLRVSEIAVFRKLGSERVFRAFPNSSRLAKTHSDSKLDLKVRIKVRNAGPYYKSSSYDFIERSLYFKGNYKASYDLIGFA